MNFEPSFSLGLFIAAVGLAMTAACGDDAAVSVSVEMTASTQPALDPYAPELGLEVVHVVIDGPGRADEVIARLEPDARAVTVSGYPLDGDAADLSIRAEGLDAQGNLIAFGRAPRLRSGGDVSVQFPLRRNLAYVVHEINGFQANPESYIYALDLNSRTLVEKIRIEGAEPRGERVTARGGDALLVTYRDLGVGYLGILSAEDHSWRRVELPVPQRVAVGVEGRAVGAVAGGGFITFVDLDAGAVVDQFPPPGGRPFGGTVLDGVIAADGATALFVLGGVQTGNVIFVDIEARSVEPLDVILEPAGVALSPDGRIAFVTSRSDPAVAEVDLRNGRVVRANGFARPVGLAAYSENMQAVLALDADPEQRRVLALLPRANCPEDVTQACGQALPVTDATPTTERPVDLAADGVGRQVLVVGAGSSTAAAGLTLIETFSVRQLPVGARSLYPGDPDDTYRVGRTFVGRQRYQPQSVAIIYGR